MTVEILRLNALTPLQILARCMDRASQTSEVIVVEFTPDGDALINYSAITPSQLALASVELAEIARQHARLP
jgi:hypothetical protein